MVCPYSRFRVRLIEYSFNEETVISEHENRDFATCPNLGGAVYAARKSLAVCLGIVILGAEDFSCCES